MTKEKENKPTHVVIKEFRDLNDFSVVHEQGKDVSDLDPERLEVLVKNGIVEKQNDK